MPLEEYFDPEVYPEGVFEIALPGEDNGEEEEAGTAPFLIGIPLAEGAWIQSISYRGQELFAFIHPRASNFEQSVEVLKRIISME